MTKKQGCFTGESYFKDEDGTICQRKKIVFETHQKLRGGGFRPVFCREYLSRREQLRQDAARLRRAEKELSGRK
ncbi:MAG: hypothetical protein LKJ17_06110 [Oscillospiraceae bacterium]|jgi:hypothetical protein|nr:hypothetical protein [Oscillospiraceae bacterium]